MRRYRAGQIECPDSRAMSAAASFHFTLAHTQGEVIFVIEMVRLTKSKDQVVLKLTAEPIRDVAPRDLSDLSARSPHESCDYSDL